MESRFFVISKTLQSAQIPLEKWPSEQTQYHASIGRALTPLSETTSVMQLLLWLLPGPALSTEPGPCVWQGHSRGLVTHRCDLQSQDSPGAARRASALLSCSSGEAVAQNPI